MPSATKVDYTVEKPLNREPPVKDLVSNFITTHGYDRNHGPIPHLSASHTITVDGLVQKELTLSIPSLQNDFPQHEIVCTLQCAGNRRHTMRTLLKEVQGIDWGDAAVMNCRWRGPKLRDVLLKAGVEANSSKTKGLHVAFACFQVECQEDKWYGGSIDLHRAMREDADVILALEMNGETLPVNRGFPVRVIVPGVAGARSVKWLDRITVQDQESANHYQRHDYKILPPEALDKESAEKFWDNTPAIQDMPINSVVAVPQSGDDVSLSANGTLEVKGYALPQGGDGPVKKVEVSSDEGQTWKEAEIVDRDAGGGKWCWALWRTGVKLEKGEKKRIISRAQDTGGNCQEQSPEWNLRGVAYDGYGEARDLTVS